LNGSTATPQQTRRLRRTTTTPASARKTQRRRPRPRPKTHRRSSVRRPGQPQLPRRGASLVPSLAPSIEFPDEENVGADGKFLTGTAASRGTGVHAERSPPHIAHRDFVNDRTVLVDPSTHRIVQVID